MMSMSLEEIYAKLTDILREIFDDDSLAARPDLTADQVAGWDSFDHLRLMFKAEQTFKITFAASQISALRDVGQLADLIQSKVTA